MVKKDATIFSTTIAYSKLKNEGRLSDFHDSDECPFINAQFEKQNSSIPWKPICLACFLFCGGIIAMLLSFGMLSGHVPANDGIHVLFFLGLIMFIPGFYHVRLAYHAWVLTPGYSFDDIPSFN